MTSGDPIMPSNEERPGTRHAARSRFTRPAVVGLVLAALGLGGVAVGWSSETGGTRVTGPSAPIGKSATDPRDITAHNSPTLVASPVNAANLVVVNRIDTPSFSCALHVSFDGGIAWTETPVPFPEGEELPERCYAPDATFGPDGVLYVSFVTLAGRGNQPNALWTVRSADGGASLSNPAKVTGKLAFQARVTADPRVVGRLFISWLQADAVATLGFPDAGYPIQLAASDDGGQTWSEPRRVSPPTRGRVVAATPRAMSDGTLFVLYLDLGEDRLNYHGAHEGRGGPPYPGPWRLVLARSADTGQHWAETVVGEVVPADRFLVFVPPFPSLAVDHARNRIYVGFQDARLGDADVWVWVSENGGVGFRPPRRVNDTPEGDGQSQYLPQLDVVPSGRLDVVYYDRRADPSNVMTETSLQSSHDGGVTFGARLALSDTAFDSSIGFGSERNLPDLGSRLGLVSTRRATLAVWSDTRLGTQASNKQVLARAVVLHATKEVSRGIALYGGATAVTLGLLLLGYGLAGTRDSGSTSGPGGRDAERRRRSAPTER